MTEEAIPAAVALVREFGNTLDVEDGTDALATAKSAREWFVAHGLLAANAAVSAADTALARSVRDRLRDVVAGLPDAAGDPWADVPLRLGFADGRPEITSAAPGRTGALGRIAAAAVAARADGSWDRLKLCAEHTCGWVFYDRSKNRSGRWCSMRVCGNRTKIRAYRQRQAR